MPAPARIATNLLGRIITKDPAVTAGDPLWPVNDPFTSFGYPPQHDAEIVAAWASTDGNLLLGCRTLAHGHPFNVYFANVHTISSQQKG
jgi:hypothetical protein